MRTWWFVEASIHFHIYRRGDMNDIIIWVCAQEEAAQDMDVDMLE